VNEPLRLNHLYRVVDRETFAAARESSWLRALFAPSEVRTTQRPDWTYTGLYLYGTSTYLELFEEGDQGPVGASGLALAIETPGATAAVAEAWRATLGAAETRVVVRPAPATADADVALGAPDSAPWFHIAHAVPDRREQLHLWSMEYHADFLAAWQSAATEARGITRREVLERYARVSGGPSEPLFDDVTAVTLALTPGEHGFLTRHLDAFDARARPIGGDVTSVEGDGITIGIAPATGSRRGVQDIVCRLRRPVGRETLTLGRLVVDVDGTRAVLKFR
jgi:hypothetical protein